MTRISAVICGVSICALHVGAQNAHVSGSEAEAGGRLFVRMCAPCHGENAKGGRGPDLTTGSWKHASGETDLIRIIREGIAGTQMPGFAIPETEARSIVAWLRTLKPKTDEPVTGNTGSGRQLFFGAGKCSGCHMVSGKGGTFGPELTRVGDRRPVAY